MNRLKALVFLFFAMLLALQACAPSALPTYAPTQDPARFTAAIQTQVADIVEKTRAAHTLIAGSTASVVAQQTEIERGVSGTLTALVTATPPPTPTFTFSPSLSPTLAPTLTLTPAFARVTVGADTNCRSGPGTVYDILGLVKAGETAEVVGQDADRGNWVIRLPSNPIIICWIWRASSTPAGNVDQAPIFTPQPTPTTAIDFGLSYVGYTSCSGAFYVKFKIINTSEFTWESNQVNVTDRTTNVTATINRNTFSNYDGCTLVGNDHNLAPGEVGVTTSNGLSNNPVGHDMKATVQVCSLDGQTGTCAAKSITFTP